MTIKQVEITAKKEYGKDADKFLSWLKQSDYLIEFLKTKKTSDIHVFTIGQYQNLCGHLQRLDLIKSYTITKDASCSFTALFI